MKSYVSTSLGPIARINEARNLYVKYTDNMSSKVRELVEDASCSEARISQLLGREVSGLRMLEIGPGQQLAQLAYFSRGNDVVGIDLDTILPTLSVHGVFKMLRHNGLMRTTKTVVRKALRIDSRVRSRLTAELGLSEMPELRVEQMDATRMGFPDDHFDVVYSRSVFEHLRDPSAVLAETHRVLRPGGVMYIRLHLYTSDSGSHDSRIYIDQREDLPYWAHLRPEHAHKVRSNTYLNRLRLLEWRRIFLEKMPDANVVALQSDSARGREELRRLRDAGELSEYSDEELFATTVEASWRKPVSASGH